MRSLSQSYQMLLYIAIVLLVYYPTQFAEISLVDDMGMLSSLFTAEHFSLLDVFFPHSAQGGYYRPLIGLSFWLDKYLWFLDEHLLHFESVIAHLVNGLLVYFICREALSHQRGRQPSYLPLAAGLLFALHPIVTESVNWISGRTDIMMGFFVLMSILALLRYRRGTTRTMLFIAVLCSIAALFAKEASFGYLPGMVLLLTFCEGHVEDENSSQMLKKTFKLSVLYYMSAFFIALFLNAYWIVLIIVFCFHVHALYLHKSTFSLTESVRRVIIVVSVGLVTIGLFAVLRKLAFSSSVGKIGQTIVLMGEDTNYTISLFLGALGFYVKKFFLPLPLSFFILEIDPLYDFIGIAVLFTISYLFIKRTLQATFALLGFLLILPALPFSLGTIAWTGYAERYLYLTSALWVIALVVWLGKWTEGAEKREHVVMTFAVSICVASAVITFGRNTTWKTNAALLKNTVEQSPKTRMLWDMYMRALLDAGRQQEAEEIYRNITTTLPAAFFDDRADLMMGVAFINEGRCFEALDLYQAAIQRTRFTSEPLLAACLRLLEAMQQTFVYSLEKRLLLEKMEHEYSARLYAITRNPAYLVEAGQRSLRRGDFEAAYNSFDAALHLMPVDNRARQLVERQKNETRNRL